MTQVATRAEGNELRVVLRGDPESLRGWIDQWDAQRLGVCVGSIFIGAGLYGAAMGYWRAPLQGVYVAIKFPLIILLVTLGNALLNAMLAPLLGLNISFRQSFLAVLLSFTIASAILGSFSPLVAYMVWNAPPLSRDAAVSDATYTAIQLTHVGIIAFAGMAANLRLVRLLQLLSATKSVARRVLFAWLVGNLFLGSQLCWILRPFIGSPGLPVQFFRQEALRGNFYETVFQSLLRLFTFD
jgi:hypothetical protein